MYIPGQSVEAHLSMQDAHHKEQYRIPSTVEHQQLNLESKNIIHCILIRLKHYEGNR